MTGSREAKTGECAPCARMSEIEALVGRTIRRDISRLVSCARGNVGRAARSIWRHPRPHVAIVTGFFIRWAEPPSPETDGLNGTAHLAAALANVGIEVTVVTDAPCAKAVWAILTKVPGRVGLEVVDVSRSKVLDLRARLQSQPTPPSHLIAIERASPGADGLPHREHGWDMSRETAPLDLLFHDAGWQRPWTTIGIGDGGNEIGMGSLPADIVRADIPNADLIASTVPVDFPIVASVSNWGAYALLGAMALARPQAKRGLLRYFTGEMEVEFLSAAVELGQAVDDSRVDRPGRPQMSVDRLSVQDHAGVIEAIREVVLREADEPSCACTS